MAIVQIIFPTFKHVFQVASSRDESPSERSSGSVLFNISVFQLVSFVQAMLEKK
jgi:hypothetical protein